MKKSSFNNFAWVAVLTIVILVPVYAMCYVGTEKKYVKGDVTVMEKKETSFWNRRIGNSDKGTSDYLHPGIAYGVSGGVFALALLIALIVIL